MELERWSLRFRDGALERAYADEEAAATRQSVFVPTLIGALTWACGGALDRVMFTEQRVLSFALTVRFAIGVPVTLALLLLGAAPPRWVKRAYQPFTAVAIATLLALMAAIQAVAANANALGYVLLGMTFTIMIAHTVLMLRFREATAATLVGVLALLIAVRSLEGSTIAYAVFWMCGATLAGMAGSYRLERSRREVFHQRKLLAEERAKTEAMLTAEVRHQVAARSRELVEALARVESASSGALQPGERFDGRYRVERVLGVGGMGAVYEVERLTDARRLALKLMPGSMSPASASRFAREAEIGARLSHENLISIVDVGVVRGAPYLVMELVTGGTLEGRREHFGDPARCLPILRQIAHGLVELHSAGVIHRDLKPANVLVDADGIAKIADFGISRFDDSVDETAATMSESSTPQNVTRTGMLLGTPQYMAPETAHGGRSATAASDVFAFGVLAYEALSGRSPFATPPVFAAIAGQRLVPPQPISTVANEISAAVLDCLAEDPAARPTAAQLRDRLITR